MNSTERKTFAAIVTSALLLSVITLLSCSTGAKQTSDTVPSSQPEGEKTKEIPYAELMAEMEAEIAAEKAVAETLQTTFVNQACNLDIVDSAGFHAIEGGKEPSHFAVHENCKDGDRVSLRLFSSKDLGIESGTISFPSISAKIAEKGCRPSSWSTLIPFHIKHPDYFRYIQPVAVGTMWELDGKSGVPCILSEDSSPMLAWCRYESDFEDNYRFLAVCDE